MTPRKTPRHDPSLWDDEVAEGGADPASGASPAASGRPAAGASTPVGASTAASGTIPAMTNRTRWLAGLLAAAAVAMAVWFGISATVGHATWSPFGYKVIDDRSVSVTFDVNRPPGMALTCTVKAMSVDFATVGTLEVPVPPSSEADTRVTATVRTTSRAVTGLVDTCREH